MGEKRRKKRPSGLRGVFVFSIFVLLLIVSLLMMPIAWIFSQFTWIGHSPLVPFALLMLLSMVIGTFLSTLVSNSILKPVKRMGDATKAVAKGDFSVRLEAPPPVVEVEEIFHDFNTMVEELASIETLRNDFVTSVSHEFKTPLAAIEGGATLLQDESATPEERQEYIEMITGATRQLSTLTGNILRLSKLESSGMPVEMQPFALDEQLRQAVLLLENEWTAAGLEMDIDLDSATYTGNEELLMQVWLNLLGNAIKFSPEGGKITVALYKTSSGVSIQVGDEGIGMAPAVARHVFEKFYQGDDSRSQQGNGLGLALVQRIVEAHGGSVCVESREGEGAVFTVRLPGP